MKFIRENIDALPYYIFNGCWSIICM